MTGRELLALVVAPCAALAATWGIAFALLTSEVVLDVAGPELAATGAMAGGGGAGFGTWRLVAGPARRRSPGQ